MNTMKAFAMGQMADVNNSPRRVFDWRCAVRLIKRYNLKNADAGLSEDMEWTSDCILRDGKPVVEDTYTYLASNWATPILVDRDTGEEFECWEFEDNSQYDSDTVWPKDALEMLNGESK